MTIKTPFASAHLVVPVLLASLFVPVPASPQSPLSLSEAIARARARNPDAGSAAAAEREAAERVTQARGGYLPKVDVAESWQRGNNPVFVFSSRLAQRHFTEADFALDALNHPDATDNFRTALSVEQALFDRTTSAKVRAASTVAAASCSCCMASATSGRFFNASSSRPAGLVMSMAIAGGVRSSA